MRLRLTKLLESDKKAKKIRIKGLNRYNNIDGMLYYQKLLCVFEIILTKLINYHYNNRLAGHFGINKNKKLIGWKYY